MNIDNSNERRSKAACELLESQKSQIESLTLTVDELEKQKVESATLLALQEKQNQECNRTIEGLRQELKIKSDDNVAKSDKIIALEEAVRRLAIESLIHNLPKRAVDYDWFGPVIYKIGEIFDSIAFLNIAPKSHPTKQELLDHCKQHNMMPGLKPEKAIEEALKDLLKRKMESLGYGTIKYPCIFPNQDLLDHLVLPQRLDKIRDVVHEKIQEYSKKDLAPKIRLLGQKIRNTPSYSFDYVLVHIITRRLPTMHVEQTSILQRKIGEVQDGRPPQPLIAQSNLDLKKEADNSVQLIIQN